MFNRPAQISLKNSLGMITAFSTAVLMWRASVHAASTNKTADIDKLMSTLYERGQFNGAILVTRQGQIIYRKGFGKADFKTGEDFRPETPSDIGSVTKQFTAMEIMVLAEHKKLSYDDPVSKYIPESSRSEHLSQITVRRSSNKEKNGVRG